MELANRFEILNILDQGNYGITYRAIDQHAPQPTPCLLMELNCYGPQVLDKFRQEARVMDILGKHSHIPKLIASFEDDDKFYIAQELIEGHDLSQEIREKKCLDEGYVLKLLTDTLNILAFVHRQRVIHRNIQPTNLIRQRNGNIVVINFGAVKDISHSQQEQPLATQTGYMAPEQLRGKHYYASDLYAVGMVAIAALTDLHPKQLPINPLTQQVRWSDKTINPALERFIKHLIDPNPKKRFPTAADAVKELERTITGIKVGQDSKLPTHVAAKGLIEDSQPVPTASTAPAKLIPPKLLLKVIGLITLVLMMLGFGVRGYQWTAYTLSRRWDTVKPSPQQYEAAKPDTLVDLLDDGSIQAKPETVNAFWAMVAAAEAEGVELLPLNGYLSLAEQRRQLQQRTNTGINIRQWLQQSDYHSGYAVAIGDKNADESTDWDVSFERTDGYRWLKRYAKNYGFELSYPRGNPAGEKEPWHWRYIAK
ncbi:MAG: D-alanyl-D-alanine carboxypeptidase family protein [Cyanobacteria bacterium P01_D01_bin.156]